MTRYEKSGVNCLLGLAVVVLCIFALTFGMASERLVYGYPYVPVERCYVTPELGR